MSGKVYINGSVCVRKSVGWVHTLTVDTPPPQQPQRERVHFDDIFFLSNTQHYSGQLKCCFALMESQQRVPDQYSRAGHFHDTCVLCNSGICSFIGGQQEFTAHGVTAHICLYISVCLYFFLFCFVFKSEHISAESKTLTNSFGVMTNTLIFNCPALA